MAMNILVVDDKQEMASFLTLYLKNKGYSSRGVCSVQEAWELLSKEKFDVVITDVCLKESSGLILLKSIKSRGDTTAVVMMSGYAQPQQVVECLNLGAYDFLFKPFHLEVLAEVLQNIKNRNQRFAEMGVDI
ncbi:MAG: response regulator [Candidatus Omnitrophica bacterium]|nr:response regulator [Candidatus Omnitrophota bacterium]